ncbi:NAD(P)-binding domain-containing protein, partial [Nonomuraea sp. NPDC055795]
MNTNRQHAVTVLGLGLMGEALARAFLRAGHPTTVWNRSPGKADRLVAEGARLAGSAAEAVAASPLVVVCLTGYDAVHDLFGPLEKILDGRVLVNPTRFLLALGDLIIGWLLLRQSEVALAR